MSIENVFTDIVIIHSDITDSSLQLIEDYCKGRNNIIVERYPYQVYPALHSIYKTGNFDMKNSLAAYYNFGMDICKKIGGSICKIDCDQVYVEESLYCQFVDIEDNMRRNPNHGYRSGLWGINSFVHNNILMVLGDEKINGAGDHYILSGNILEYYQSPFYEMPQYLQDTSTLNYLNMPCWFHFRRRIQRVNNLIAQEFTLENYVCSGNEILYLDDDLIEIFEKSIRPLLVKSESKYCNVVFHD